MNQNLGNLNLSELNTEIQKFSEERNWDQFHSVKNLAMALTVESAELLEVFQWLTEAQSNEIRTNEKIKLKAEEELADIFIYLIRILNKSDINIESAILNKMKRNAEKYPVELSKGNAKKYNEF